jgi:hypothetical protein
MLLRILLSVPGAIVALGALAWAGFAIWFDGPASRLLAGFLAAVVGAAALGMLTLVRPLGRGVAGFVVVWLVVLGWWLSIPPRADRDWQPDVARVPTVEFAGDRVRLRNVRNFDYRSETDFTERWEDRTYDLSQLGGFDLFVSYWGPTLIAHTIASWEFADGRPLAISIETRKQRGETYSALLGFFRQYELYYVVADERDVVGLRTNHRGEQVFLYRIRDTPELARKLLVAYLEEVDRLAKTPEWYNALTHNCTTTIRTHVRQAHIYRTFDWRILANGRGDEMLYERGDIDTTLPFAEMRARSDVTARAKAADGAPDFSARIREGLPTRPAWREIGG